MKITRQAGIFPITFDTEKADFEARVNYNKLGFLADILIEVNDTLTETNVYKQGIKLHAKGQKGRLRTRSKERVLTSE